MSSRLLFVFDMDDVLYDYDWRIRMAGLTALTGHDLPELRRRWWNERGEWAAEAGGYPSAESYHEAVTAAMGVEIPIDEWLANRRSAMTPWPRSIQVVERAAELGQVSLLTNNGPLVEAHLETLAPEIADVFRGHLRTSSHYGARKPDPQVFLNLLASYAADASDVFFADDLAPNVAGAESVGITAHQFIDAAGMMDAVEAFARSRGVAVWASRG